jgi:hypothetical protein
VSQEIAICASDLDRFPCPGLPRDLTDGARKDPRVTPQDGFFAAFLQDDGLHERLAGFRFVLRVIGTKKEGADPETRSEENGQLQ